jgi:hypothetical protein
MGLISERGTGRLYANKTTGIFGFSHALFHKALYDSLFETQKAHLHHQCFELLKTEWDPRSPKRRPGRRVILKDCKRNPNNKPNNHPHNKSYGFPI